VLGLRLVKKSVNQDDTSAYHMFYADKLASPGSDMTFFDWPQTPPTCRGTDSLANTLFRVNGRAALDYWITRFEAHAVKHASLENFAGRDRVRFEDPEGQRLSLVDDHGARYDGEPWDGTDVPADYALRGFHGVLLSVPNLARMEPIFTELMNWEKVDTHPSPENAQESVTIYGMDGGGPGKGSAGGGEPRARPGRLGAAGFTTWPTGFATLKSSWSGWSGWESTGVQFRHCRALLLQVAVFPHFERHPVRAGH
jgi:glyoxalase family protein